MRCHVVLSILLVDLVTATGTAQAELGQSAQIVPTRRGPAHVGRSGTAVGVHGDAVVSGRFRPVGVVVHVHRRSHLVQRVERANRGDPLHPHRRLCVVLSMAAAAAAAVAAVAVLIPGRRGRVDVAVTIIVAFETRIHHMPVERLHRWGPCVVVIRR